MFLFHPPLAVHYFRGIFDRAAVGCADHKGCQAHAFSSRNYSLAAYRLSSGNVKAFSTSLYLYLSALPTSFPAVKPAGQKKQEYKESQGVEAGRKRTRTLAQTAFDGLQFVLSKTIQLLGMLVASAIRALGQKLCVGHVDAEIVLRTPEKCLTRERRKTERQRQTAQNQCQTWDSKAPSLGGLAGTGPVGGVEEMMGAVDGRFFAMAPFEMVPWYVLSLPSYSFGNSQPGCARSLLESGAPRTEGPSFVGIGIASIEGM